MFICVFLTLLPCGLRVKGLPTKKKYSFRVLAENLAGPGKPSVETDPILVKDPIGTSPTAAIDVSMTILKGLLHLNCFHFIEVIGLEVKAIGYL